MKNQDIKSGLFGSIGENMVAFELAKRNWYVYRPYFDTRIDFVAQKFVCKNCFSDWESKHVIICPNNSCNKFNVSLNDKDYEKQRKCLDCGYLFVKYSKTLVCPSCNAIMQITEKKSKQGQRNFEYICSNQNCGKNFTSQTRRCVKCDSKNCIEYPTCKSCHTAVVPQDTKCTALGCKCKDYAVIFRTIQIKSSHEEETGSIGFNFKIQDLVNDERHFLVVYSRTFEDYKEKHNYWVMTVDEYKNLYLGTSASTLIYQSNRLHPPSENSSLYFDEPKYNKTKLLLQLYNEKHNKFHPDRRKFLDKILKATDVFAKLNDKKTGDF